MSSLHPTGLRTEYLTDPLGLDVAQPRLFWHHTSDVPGAGQTAYRILVARTPEALANGVGDLWDSGRVESWATTHIRYEGPALADLERAWWKVMAWDESGVPSDWSLPGFWESGLREWASAWIGDEPLGGPFTSAPCPYLRTEFTLDEPAVRARLVVTALGLYEARLNGERVGEDVLTPGWTDYRKRVRYQVYDVTPQIQVGANCLGAILGDGWYCGHVEWRGRQLYGDAPRLRAELHLQFADGRTRVIATGPDWQAGYGELLEADLLMGIAIDHRRTVPGWDRVGFDASGWRPVRVLPHPEGLLLVGQREPTVQVTEEVRPVTVEVQPGWPRESYLVDLGQNIVGAIRIRLRGPAGATVRVRYGERKTAEGKIYTENLRSAKQTDTFTLRGDPEGEEFEPSFTFHGFQYVEIRGPIEPIGPDDLVGLVMHSANAKTGEFVCSDPLVNRLQQNIDWGWRGNSVDVPTDCPQRDERLGWTGDAQVFVRTACFNRDVAAFFAKYVQDLEDAQSPSGAIPAVAPNTTSLDSLEGDGGPAWADAFLIVPWTLYQVYGDVDILARHYPAMRRFVRFLEAQAIEGVRCHPDQKGFRGFGDWLSTNAETPNDLIGTAFLAHSAGLLAKIAGVLGEGDDAAEFALLRARTKDVFQRRFMSPDGLMVAQTQTAAVLALRFDLAPENVRPMLLQALVDDIGRRGWKLSTGFVGTPYLNPVLTEGGRPDVAYRLLFQRQWPSWLYPVTQGATTIWERWDGWTHDKGFQDIGMNSFNHYAYGAIGEWLYGYVAGLDIDEAAPGYRHFIVRPVLGEGLEHAEATLETLHGRAVIAWRRGADRVEVRVVVPPNTRATIWLPGADTAIERPAGDWRFDVAG